MKQQWLNIGLVCMNCYEDDTWQTRIKTKGTYHEKWFVEWLRLNRYQSQTATPQWIIGGEYSGDIKLELCEIQMVGGKVQR